MRLGIAYLGVVNQTQAIRWNTQAIPTQEAMQVGVKSTLRAIKLAVMMKTIQTILKATWTKNDAADAYVIVMPMDNSLEPLRQCLANLCNLLSNLLWVSNQCSLRLNLRVNSRNNNSLALCVVAAWFKELY